MLVRRGFAALIAVPLVLLALMFATEAKFAMLVLWILSLVIICTFLIVIEYLHVRVIDKTNLSNMSQEELYEMLDDELKAELLAFAPIEKMRLDKGARLAAAQAGLAGAAGAQGGADEAAEADAEKTTAMPARDQKGGDE